MTLKSKLNRFKSHISKNEDQIKKTEGYNIDFPFKERWEEFDVSPYHFDNQFCLVRKVKFPITFQHGIYSLGDFLKAVELWNENNINHPLSSKGYKANELFFFDTETTGLGGGTGNSIFILGHASLNNNEFVLTQHILPNPGCEIPLYHSFLSQVDYRTLVTYNGKSFDWPQVKTRHTLIREHVPKLPEFGHFDLFHAAKRLWKHKLERMKLSIVEKDVLGVNRVDDVPGFLAPMIYFDFVERKDPEGMRKVLKHNETDILSLITLYAHLSFQLLGVDKNRTMNEKYEIGRWFSSLGEVSSAKTVYQEIVQENTHIAFQSQLNLGYIYKKQQQFDTSLEYFRNVANQDVCFEIKIEACVEVAKMLEHRNKKYQEAISYCDTALNLINQGVVHKKITGADIIKRKERNIRKNNFLGKRKIHDISSK